MRLPKLAIENYQFTLVMVLLIIALGITSLRTMPRAEDPQFTFPGFSVLFVYPGANPEDVEQLVVDPLERQLNELDDVKEIRTRIEEGFAVTVIEFFTSVDTDEAEDDVRMTAANARAEMPEAVFAPVLQKFSPTGVAMMQVALISETAPYAELQDLVEELQDALERTSGVKRVETWAYPETEVHVDVDLDRLGYRNVTLSQVAQALQSANANVPGGSLDIGSRRFSVRSTGDYESIEDIANTVVSAGPSGVVYLRDLADVRPGQAELNYHARFNGKRAVFATVLQQDGTNIYEVRENIESALETFGTQVPSNVEMDLVFDQKVSVEARLGQFFSNLFQGLLLVGLVVMLVLGLRAASIVMTAIPVSLLAAVAIFDYTGYALQQMSIVGLMIALGLLVDNAIVVVENIHRFRRMGHDGPTAAVLATKQVGWAIVSSTVTTVLSFLPMVFLGGGSGSFIRSMPVAVICALFASLFIALTLTPYLASRLIKADERRQPWFQRQFERISEGAYAQTLSLALKRPVVTGLLAVGLLAGSLALFPFVGVSLFPKAETQQFMIEVELPDGSALHETDRVVRYVEGVLGAHEGVEGYASNIGRGNPRVYYNVVPEAEKSAYAQIYVDVVSERWQDRQQVADDLRATFAETGPAGATVRVEEFMQGPPLEAPVVIKVLGEELETLGEISDDVAAMLQRTEGTTNIDNPLGTSAPTLRVDVNREKAGRLGVPLVEIDRTVRASIAGLPVTTYRTAAGDERSVVLRLPTEGDRAQLSDLDRVRVSSITGAQVPLSTLAETRFEAGPSKINHVDLERGVSVTSDVLDGYTATAVAASLVEQLDAYPWPAGYRYAIGGELEQTQESFGGLLQALLVALFGIFGVLVLQFRSFRQPLIVFAAIPLAIVGAVLALFITGYTFSFTAGVGLTSLVGIVINNAIILIDYANQLRAEGRSVVDAVTESAQARFTPIVLTTLTTIGGLLPLTLTGSSLWSPFGWAVIGGLLASTFLTLLLVPVLYKALTKEEAVLVG